MTAVITDEKIPNNVNLAGDRRLQRALEAWQPHFLDWWQQMGALPTKPDLRGMSDTQYVDAAVARLGPAK